MNYNKPIRRQTAGVIRHSCALLFALFSFCYLYFMQGYLLEEVQHVYSHGVTTYSIPIGAVIITLLLLILQAIVQLLTRLPAPFHALSYYPSMLALAMLTSWNEQTVQSFSLGNWTWLLPLLIIIFVVLSYSIKTHYKGDDRNIASTLCGNYIQLFAMALLCGSAATASDNYQYELKMQSLLSRQRYEEALQTGLRSRATTPRLSSLRAYALSKLDQLPERMFDYPWPDADKGLLLLDDTLQSRRIGTQAICLSLGAMPGKTIADTERYLLRLEDFQQQLRDSLETIDTLFLAQNDSLRQEWQNALTRLQIQEQRTHHYHLCLLLLRRDLRQFRHTYSRFHPVDTLSTETMPRAYRQAFALIDTALVDTATIHLYQEYQTLHGSILNATQRRNLTRRHFGNTYWWYYHNP